MKILNPIFLTFIIEKIQLKKILIIILALNLYFNSSAQNQSLTFSLKFSEQSTYKNLTKNNTLLFLNKNSNNWEIITGEAFGVPFIKTNKIVILLPSNSLTVFDRVQLKNTNNDIFNYNLDNNVIKEQKFESNYNWKEILFIDKANKIILTQSFNDIIDN